MLGGQEVYTDMEQWAAIRRRVLVEGVSKREVLRETGMHWRTLEKVLSHAAPPGYRVRQPRRKPKLGPFVPRIRQILAEDKTVPRKQRHTAKRIFERLREEGYTGGYTQVKAAVREMRQRGREVFVPLVHRPGEAQVDFGYALVKEGVSFDPVHYLALLERKPGSLDHARPFEGWTLPESFAVLRRRLENEQEREGGGTREYIAVLRLLERHPLRAVSRAVERGLRMNALTRDAIAQFLVPRDDWRATTFPLDGRDHLRRVRVAQTHVAAYAGLLAAGGAQ